MSTLPNKIVEVDLVERAKSLLLHQFQDKQNITKVVEALVEQVQELDNTALDLQEVRKLDNAYGVYLDHIGERLKVARTTLNDERYRTAIKVRMLQNSSRGGLEDIKKLVNLVTYNLPNYIVNTQPYVIELTAYLACLNTESGIDIIKSLFPVNVAVKLQNSTSTPFGFSGNPNAKGFSSKAGTSFQGQLTSLVATDYGVVDNPKFTISDTLIVSEDTGTVNSKSKPVIKNNPVITPPTSVREGTILTASTGSWASLSPLVYTYQWYVDGAAVAGSTLSSYTVLAADKNELVFCAVKATNVNGSTTANTGSVLVTEDAPLPTNDIVDGLGLQSAYIALEPIADSAILNITFRPDGTVRVLGSGVITTITNYHTTPSSGIGSNYEVQYVNITGDSLNGPVASTWYTISSDVQFFMAVSEASVEVGGQQLIKLRNKTTGNIYEKSVYFSVTCGNNS